MEFFDEKTIFQEQQVKEKGGSGKYALKIFPRL